MKALKTIIFILAIIAIALVSFLMLTYKSNKIDYTLAEVESTVSKEVSNIYSNEDSLIELNNENVRIIDIKNKRIFTIVLNEPLLKEDIYETKIAKMKKMLNGVYMVDDENSYQYFVENLAIAILPSAEVVVLRSDKLKGVVRLPGNLTNTTVVPNIDQAIKNYNEANMRFPDLRKYMTTSFDTIVVDDLNMKFHIFSPEGNLVVGMQGEFPKNIPQLTITEMLSNSRDLDLGLLLRSKHDNFVFQYTCNIGDYVLSLDTMGQQYLYNTLTDSYEFITTVN